MPDESVFDNERFSYVDKGILMYPVKSSFVDAIGHDAINNVLAVKLNYGFYHYAGVSKAIFNSFLWAESKGRFFNQHISNNFKVIEYNDGYISAVPPPIRQQPTKPPITAYQQIAKIEETSPTPAHETTKKKKVDGDVDVPKFRDFLLHVLVVVFGFFIGYGWYVIWLALNWICDEAGASELICILLPSLLMTIAILFIAVGMTLNDAREKIDEAEKKVKAANKLAEKRIVEKWKSEYKEQFEKLASEQQQTYPWMAQQVADLFFGFDERIAHTLRFKSHPALKAAEEVKRIAQEKRVLQRQCKMWEYQFNYLETLFPWLPDFEEVDPREGAKYVGAIDENPEKEYDSLQKWLSPEEYTKLPSAQKYQLALERYNRRPKKPWEVGVAFERYVGYLFENKDFIVKFNGATEHKEDMGIDILATKGDTVIIIQCKRYSVIRQRVVHENTVFQLFGTTTLYKIHNPEFNVIPAIYSTYELSDIAKQCAEILNIELHENVAMPDYPMIKCNVAKDGEKIYHLPFDQQYDKVQISGKKGACYVETVAEAEALGFRRAYRWRPSNTEG